MRLRRLGGWAVIGFLSVSTWLSVQAFTCREVPTSSLQLHASRGVFLLEEQPYTGTAIGRRDDGLIESVEPFRRGRRHGERLRYHPNDVLAQRSSYVDGRLHGQSTTWFQSGKKRSEGVWQDGVAQGVHRQWYRSGAVFKERRLKDGLESGLQRAWRENGAVYNNYEARDGRIYGLRRSKLCVDLDLEPEEQEVLSAR